MNPAELTPLCQDEFCSSALVAALESAWAAIRVRHADVPAAVIVLGPGAPAGAASGTKLGHFAQAKWQNGSRLVSEVLVTGEGLRLGAEELLGTLLHEAAHGMASARTIVDTSRQGRWHNKKFAVLCEELGLDAAKDDKLGWSTTTVRPVTLATFAGIVVELGLAMSAYRNPDERPAGAKASTSNGRVVECGCPRKIRVSVSTAAEGPILCGVCETRFVDDDTTDGQG